jgi:hypothetical protein
VFELTLQFKKRSKTIADNERWSAERCDPLGYGSIIVIQKTDLELAAFCFFGDQRRDYFGDFDTHHF